MTEMQAAIGRIQLTRIDDWNNKRDNNAQVLIKALEPFADEGGPIRLPKLSCEKVHKKQTLTKLANMLTISTMRTSAPKTWRNIGPVTELSKRSTLSGLLVFRVHVQVYLERI